jgi:hypothetical protein
MPVLEKRYSPRQSARIPLRFRALNLTSGTASPPENELISETSNISMTGLFMRSPRRLPLGTPLSLTLRVPTSISGSYRSFVHCLGHVVHECAFPDGNHGYGIHFTQVLPFSQPPPHINIPPDTYAA